MSSPEQNRSEVDTEGHGQAQPGPGLFSPWSFVVAVAALAVIGFLLTLSGNRDQGDGPASTQPEATPIAVAGGRTTIRVTGAPAALPEAATWTANPPAPAPSVSALDLNVTLTDLEVPQPTPSPAPTPTPTPSPTRTPAPTPIASPTHAPTRTPKPTNPPKPTATPGPSWILVADSFADYPGSDETRHFWYLWSNGRNNFYWQDMKWDQSSWCYRGPVDWQLRICQDSITADGRGDVSLLWKNAQGGTYRLEWDSDAMDFYWHTNPMASQGPGSRLAHSVVVHDIIEWNLFFWLARSSTPYHILVFRLVQP